jgi:hypothetical protein
MCSFPQLDQYEKRVLQRERPINVRYKTKVFRTLFVVVVVFVVCRIPFTALIFLRADLQGGPQTMNQVSINFLKIMNKTICSETVAGQLPFFRLYIRVFTSAEVSNPVIGIWCLRNSNYRLPGSYIRIKDYNFCSADRVTDMLTK